MEAVNKLMNEIEVMLLKELEKAGNKDDAKTATELSKPNQLDELSNYNIMNFNVLNAKFTDVTLTNIPINEKISIADNFIMHIEALLEVKRHSALKPDIDFCNAIFTLCNNIKEYKLKLGVGSLGLNDKAVITETNGSARRTKVLEYNETEFNQKQLVFFFNQLKNQRILTSDITNVEIANAVEILTGRSAKKIAQELSGIAKMEFSKQEKEQIKLKLDKIGKAVDMIKDKNNKL